MDGKSIFELFKTDAERETKGQWFRLGQSEFLLARAGGSNTRFTAAYAAAARPLQKQQSLGTLTEEQARESLAEPFSKYVLLDWRTRTKDASGTEIIIDHQIKGQDGEPVAYSQTAAKQLLMTMPSEVFNALVEQASSWTTYSADDQDTDAKN